MYCVEDCCCLNRYIFVMQGFTTFLNSVQEENGDLRS